MRHSPSDPRALLVRLHGSYKMRVTTSRTENPQGFVGVEMYWGLYNFFQWFEVSITTNGEKMNTPMCSANYPDKFAKFLGKQLCHAQWPCEKCCKGVSSRHENVCCSIGCFHSSTILSCRLAAEVFWLRHFKVLGLVNIWFGLIVDTSKNLPAKNGEFKPNISPRAQINAMWVWLRFCSSDIRHQTIIRALAALAAIFAKVQPEEARRIETLECLKAPSEPKTA